MAARSFTLPPGFRYSSLTNTSADPAGTSFFNCNIGVSPTSFVMSSLTRSRGLDVVEGTLQGKEGTPQRQCVWKSTDEGAAADHSLEFNANLGSGSGPGGRVDPFFDGNGRSLAQNRIAPDQIDLLHVPPGGNVDPQTHGSANFQLL